MEDLYTIILAGGKGTRMDSDLPKVLVPLVNKPLISYLLEGVDQARFSTTPVIVVGYQADSVKEALGDNYTYVFQEQQLGTGHAVQVAQSELKHKAKTIMVLYGDHPFLRAETLQEIALTHVQSGEVLTIATTVVSDFNDWREGFYSFGRIIRNNEGNIDRIVEKKDASKEELEIQEVNPAYFCIDAEWLWKSLTNLRNDNAQGEYYLTDLVHMAIEEGRRIASVSIDPVEALGVNTKEQLALVEQFV